MIRPLEMLLIGVTLLSVAGCERTRRTAASEISMADAEAASQLISGFYGIESERYRWTARGFVVALKPPPGSVRTGAVLELTLFLPPAQIEQNGPMTLGARVDETTVEPEIFSKPGIYTYSRNLPGELMDTNLVPISFCFNKATPPGATEPRTLGAVVTRVSLKAR